MGKAHGLQKSTETARVAGQPFLLDLFPQIGRQISAQCGFPVLLAPNHRQHTPAQGGEQVKACAQFRTHEWMECQDGGPAGQSVNPLALQFP